MSAPERRIIERAAVTLALGGAGARAIEYAAVRDCANQRSFHNEEGAHSGGTPMVTHLRALAVFASVVNTGSFRGAARELDLSPSVVSHHVSSLERRLRVILLHRSTRKLTLTPDGKRLFDVTNGMLNSAEEVFHEIARNGEDTSGTLRISVPAATGSGPLLEHFASFMRLHPRIQLVMHLTEDLANLSGEDYDLMLHVRWPQQTTKGMNKLYSVPGRLVASPTYLAERQTPEHPRDLTTWDWIRFSPGPLELEVTHAKSGLASIRGIERVSVDSLAAALKLALLGIGVTRVPDFLADPYIQSGQLIEILPQWKLSSPGIYAALPPRAPKTGILWKLYEFLLLQTSEMSLTA